MGYSLTLNQLHSMLYMLIKYRNFEFRGRDNIIAEIEDKSVKAVSLLKRAASKNVPLYTGTIYYQIDDIEDQAAWEALEDKDPRKVIKYAVITHKNETIQATGIRIYQKDDLVLYTQLKMHNFGISFCLTTEFKQAGITTANVHFFSNVMRELFYIRTSINNILRMIKIFIDNENLESITISEGKVFNYDNSQNILYLPHKVLTAIMKLPVLTIKDDRFSIMISTITNILATQTPQFDTFYWQLIDSEFLEFPRERRPDEII